MGTWNGVTGVFSNIMWTLRIRLLGFNSFCLQKIIELWLENLEALMIKKLGSNCEPIYVLKFF